MTASCACPTEYPDWHQKEIELGNHWAHVQKIPALLSMPLAYDHYVKTQFEAIQRLELQERYPGLVLTQTGIFGGRLIRLLENGSSAAYQVQRLPDPWHLSGWLHQGGIGTIKSSLRQLQQRLLDQGRLPKELFLCHLTCPTCARDKGGERILLLRRWEASARLQARLSRQRQSN